MILRNISQATLNKNKLLNLISNYPHVTDLPLTLTNFLRIYPDITLEDIYKIPYWTIKISSQTSKIEDIYKIKVGKFGGWNALIAASNQDDINEADFPIYAAYYRAINNRILVNTSFTYLRFVKALCESNFSLTNLVNIQSVPERHCQLFAVMCHYDFWDKTAKQAGFSSISSSIATLNISPLKEELLEVITLLIERLETQEFSMPSVENEIVDNSPLKMHVRFPKEHILIAFGDTTIDRKSSSREGVLNITSTNTELLFVTLNKCEKQFSVTTMYHDYAISPTLFHWQTQNSSKPTSGKGLSYIEHKQNKKTLILFVREQAKDAYGKTMGFVNFGPVELVKYEGSQPMNITWRLKHPMPTYMWHNSAKLAVG